MKLLLLITLLCTYLFGLAKPEVIRDNPDSSASEISYEKLQKGLFIDGKRRFTVKVLDHLQKLTNYRLDVQLLSGKVIIYGIDTDEDHKENGNELIKDLIYSESRVTIKYSKDGNNEFKPDTMTKMILGEPMGGVVYYNPRKRKGGTNVKGRNRRPPYVGLAHELIHSRHSINGIAQMGELDNSCTSYEEVITQEEHNTRMEENKIRKELQLPARKIPLKLECYQNMESIKMLENFFQIVSPKI